MAGRITQVVTETPRGGDPDARVTQVAVEAPRYGDPDARITQVVIEVVRAQRKFGIQFVVV